MCWDFLTHFSLRNGSGSEEVNNTHSDCTHHPTVTTSSQQLSFSFDSQSFRHFHEVISDNYDN
jgi:hypothetical protein